MVEVHLSDNEKVEILLLAGGLFSVALLLSICLAVSYCPLNRWLIERHSRRKRQQHLSSQQQPHHLQRQISSQQSQRRFGATNLIIGSHQYSCRGGYKGRHLGQNYSGPPPAYEAALRATRLQSLTGSLPPLIGEDGKPTGESLEWLQYQNQQQESLTPTEKQIDFGDYFHQPKECQEFAPPPSVFIPVAADPSMRFSTSSKQQDERSKQACERNQRRPPIMLRLWVKMMEPGELVARAKKAQKPRSRRASLTRQVSIPQLFGSLVNLASSRMGTTATNSETASQADLSMDKAPDQNQTVALDSNSNEMNSMVSTTSSGSSNNEEYQSKHQAAIEIASVEPNPKDSESLKASHQPQKQRHQSAPTKCQSQAVQLRSLSAHGSITSRVLHMNVASFSYVKDESLISTKKHNQMNYQHFCSSPASLQKQLSGANSKSASGAGSKFCQLMISVCDVENLLNNSWLDERPCALLASTSSVYVQCEILTAKGSKSARILRYPLKALNHSQGESKTHTLDFASTIPAAAVERPPMMPYGPALLPGHSSTDQSLTSTEGTDSSLSRSTATSCSGNQPPESIATQPTIVSTNWRHEPSADGKSIVVFNSVPKQIAQSQTELRGTPVSDLIQFDSVFVSPIFSKSIIEDGYVRFRFYSQCKYVNETCLAELKLPLRQLLQSETHDNLGDASHTNHNTDGGTMQLHLQQAELILDNLLANLVTASNGSPLSALIEQISAEERECNEAANQEQQQAETSTSFRLPWMLTSSQASQPVKQNQGGSSAKAQNLRSSCSLSESLNKLNQDQLFETDQYGDYADERVRELEATREHEKRIERNYCRSLLVSHWLNYLAAPAYECQLTEEIRGKLILGFTYLSTSNRVIFNAHRATIDEESYSMAGGAQGKQMMKNLRLQSSTCYLLRFMMVTNGRVIKRKQTPATRKPEWDSQEAITFDLVSVSVDQPNFIVALVVRNVAPGTGSLQNLRQNCCGCGLAASQLTAVGGYGHQRANQVQSDPESLNRTYNNGNCGNPSDQDLHETHCAFYRHNGGRDLVIGHLVLGEQIWREMKAQPRRQIVRQFKIY